MTQKTAVIFGGTGFIGRHVVRELAARGVLVKVATRVPERAYFLKTSGDVGQIVPVVCDYGDYDGLANLVQGADYVVNCVGILFEKRKGDFTRVHAEFAESIAAACAVAGVGRFVHISALGVDESTSKYAASKLDGERRVAEAYKGAVILRPSIVFGEDDNFFNQFARLAAVLPVLPLIGGGKTKFQPVFVGDVADAIMRGLTDASTNGVYQLGGPEIVTFEQVYERLFAYTGRKRCLVSLPFGVAKIQAIFLSLLPTPLLTRDQVESLKTDSIVAKNAAGLADLGIEATALDMILPQYLGQYKVGGRFA